MIDFETPFAEYDNFGEIQHPRLKLDFAAQPHIDVVAAPV